MTRRFVIALGVLALSAFAATDAQARVTVKKAIWGPVRTDGASHFPTYADLGVGIFQTMLRWDEIAPTRPARAEDPSDPAYRWPPSVDDAIAEGAAHGIEVALMLIGSPGWANGHRPAIWAPQARDFAAFATAAARRYPRVRFWLVWGEPSKASNFQPLPEASPIGPRRYATLLDRAYGALKRVRRSNLVVGGNTYTSGAVRPRHFLRWLRMPDGRRPRLDLYGHNPFSAREPELRKPALGRGFADFSDLDELMRWVDQELGMRQKRRIRLFLSEFGAPTDHAGRDFNFWVTRETQARWATRALRIARRHPRIFTLGWVSLFDESPDGRGTELTTGLIDANGRQKPAYAAFRDG